jgi:hypothetical protein
MILPGCAYVHGAVIASAYPRKTSVEFGRKWDGDNLRYLRKIMTSNMMKLGLASGAVVSLMMATVPAMAYTGQELAKQARVSITELGQPRCEMKHW